MSPGSNAALRLQVSQGTAEDVQAIRAPIQEPGTCLANTDCREWINPAANGQGPTFPRNGRVEYTWVQGRYQVTKHTIQGLGKAGYPAIKRYTSMTQGRGGDITALNVYEHDYKLDSNGYASTDPDFRWSTNLWGAYRETRASGAGPKLDFTIGSLHTWLLDASKVYTVNVYVPLSQRSDRPKGSTAHLVAEILPNDGGFVPGAMGGCSLPIDPLDNDRLLDLGATDLSWCAGVGGGLGAQTDHRVLIAKAGFPVGEEVRCWSWVVNHGGRAC